MRTMRALLPAFVVLTMVLAVRTVKADCVGYDDFGSIPCSGANGCHSQWELITCGFGCDAGTCEDDGNSTECCGTKHEYAQIVGDGGACGECGGIRFHAGAAHASPQHNAELRQGYTPGLIMLSANLSYRPSQLVYTLNRCNHKYELTVEEGRSLTVGGM
jgi:hypothetical protein